MPIETDKRTNAYKRQQREKLEMIDTIQAEIESCHANGMLDYDMRAVAHRVYLAIGLRREQLDYIEELKADLLRRGRVTVTR